jgi:hypothetical protein
MTLQRLVLTFKREGVEIRALYRKKDGPAPNTKACRREVTELARSGLQDALEALQGAECVGTSVFTTRKDVLLATTSPDVDKLVEGA